MNAVNVVLWTNLPYLRTQDTLSLIFRWQDDNGYLQTLHYWKDTGHLLEKCGRGITIYFYYKYLFSPYLFSTSYSFFYRSHFLKWKPFCIILTLYLYQHYILIQFHT